MSVIVCHKASSSLEQFERCLRSRELGRNNFDILERGFEGGHFGREAFHVVLCGYMKKKKGQDLDALINSMDVDN